MFKIQGLDGKRVRSGACERREEGRAVLLVRYLLIYTCHFAIMELIT